MNLYGFVGNDSILKWDLLGLQISFTGGFSSSDEAGIAGTRAAVFFKRIRKPYGAEGCGQVCCKDGDYGYSGPVIGTDPKDLKGNTVVKGMCDISLAPCPDGWKRTGYYHSHPNDGDFNFLDYTTVAGWGDGYVGGGRN